MRRGEDDDSPGTVLGFVNHHFYLIRIYHPGAGFIIIIICHVCMAIPLSLSRVALNWEVTWPLLYFKSVSSGLTSFFSFWDLFTVYKGKVVVSMASQSSVHPSGFFIHRLITQVPTPGCQRLGTVVGSVMILHCPLNMFQSQPRDATSLGANDFSASPIHIPIFIII